MDCQLMTMMPVNQKSNAGKKADKRKGNEIIGKQGNTKEMNIPDTVLLSLFMSSNYKCNIAYAF